MKKLNYFIYCVLMLIVSTFATSCFEEEETIDLPVVQTLEVNQVEFTTAMCYGEVIETGGDDLTERGFCWDTASNPTLHKFYITLGMGAGPFSTRLDSLTENTNYYLRAFAKNSAGVVYGQELNFNTLHIPTPMELITADSWKWDQLTLNGENILSQIDACIIDNFFVYNGNGTGYIDDNTVKCNPNDPQQEAFVWSFSNNQTRLNIDGDIFTIDELTSTRLVFSINENGNLIVYTFIH